MRVGVVGFERDRARKGRRRFPMAAELDQRMTKEIVRFGMIRRPRQQVLEACRRFCILPEPREQLATMQQRQGVAGIEDQRTVVGRDRFGRASEPIEDHAAIGHNLGRGPSPHGGLDQTQGFDVVSAPGAEDGAPIERVGIRGIGFQDRGIEALRLVETALRLQLKTLQNLRAEIARTPFADRSGHRRANTKRCCEAVLPYEAVLPWITRAVESPVFNISYRRIRTSTYAASNHTADGAR